MTLAMKCDRLLVAGMSVAFVLLMGPQITGRAGHEWLGLALLGLALAHQWPHRAWHARLRKVRYTTRRAGTTILTLLLATAFCLTAATCVLMSGHAVPFLAASAELETIRRLHTALSHWSFVLAGVHCGMHGQRLIGDLTGVYIPSGLRLPGLHIVALLVFSLLGLYLFIPARYADYMLFRAPFVFLDYDKPWIIVAGENALRFATLIGIAAFCRELRDHFSPHGG